MNGWKLIGLTLKQLHQQFDVDPDAFNNSIDTSYKIHLYDLNKDTINWCPTIPLDASDAMADPVLLPIFRKQTHIILSFMKNEFTCYITDTIISGTMDGKSYTRSGYGIKWLTRWTSTYKSFRRLVKRIEDRKICRLNEKFLRDLVKTFPSTLDEHILGDKDEQ